jgi:hypothetical protein
VGIEYRLSFSYPDKQSVEGALTRLADATLAGSFVEFRCGAHDTLPDASAAIEETGLYFCDHGGAGRDYLGRVIALLVAKFGDVVVAEL